MKTDVRDDLWAVVRQRMPHGHGWLPFTIVRKMQRVSQSVTFNAEEVLLVSLPL